MLRKLHTYTNDMKLENKTYSIYISFENLAELFNKINGKFEITFLTRGKDVGLDDNNIYLDITPNDNWDK